MQLHDARRGARVSPEGLPVLLEEQDRTCWDRTAIGEGTELLDRALRMHRLGPYQLQAAIAAVHAHSAAPEHTDWQQIAALYDLLQSFNPSPIVALNRAVAVAMACGPERGLALIDRTEVAGALAQYRWLHAARAALLQRVGRREAAAVAYGRALQLTENATERAFLTRRLMDMQDRDGDLTKNWSVTTCC
jgi:RNA polymerase sigma-70 factor (ECF subfamily)